MHTTTHPPIAAVVQHHFDEADVLRSTRSLLVRAPHIKLHLLRRHDNRLAAHLDGLAVAGDLGRELCSAALSKPSRGSVFTAAINAISQRESPMLDQLLGLADASHEAIAGLVSAFGWVSAPSLRGIAQRLLTSNNATHRNMGLRACVMHHVDPGTALNEALTDAACELSAVRAAGKLGRSSLLGECTQKLALGDARHQFHSALSSMLLGDRNRAVQSLQGLACVPGPYQSGALMSVAKMLTTNEVRDILNLLARDASLARLLIRGIGVAGDPHYVPWLIQHMKDQQLMRLAGESFSLITGLDLEHLELVRKPPENFEPGPNDDPDDSNVAMDEDDSLPWPDAEGIAVWWQANSHRFAAGTRYFMGAPPSPAHCLGVLKTGFQRQRIAAAEYLCLMAPGTALFNTAAPAWRQQRLLAQMGA